MKEKRVVTKDAEGNVIRVVEHYDLLAEYKKEVAKFRASVCLGIVIGILFTAYLFRSGVLGHY